MMDNVEGDVQSEVADEVAQLESETVNSSGIKNHFSISPERKWAAPNGMTLSATAEGSTADLAAAHDQDVADVALDEDDTLDEVDINKNPIDMDDALEYGALAPYLGRTLAYLLTLFHIVLLSLNDLVIFNF